MGKEGNINWMGYEWMTRQKWGERNPKEPNVWYGKGSVECYGEAEPLRLNVTYDPKNVDEKNANFVKRDYPCDFSKEHADYRIGLIRTKETFGYGDFEIACTLPNMQYLWPSFWFGVVGSWPPEIDVFEGYSGKYGDYKHNCLMVRVEPNVHYTSDYAIKHPEMENKPDYMVGPKKTLKCKYNFHGGKNCFKLKWRENYIKIYHNGHRVMCVRNKKILSQFVGKKIFPIINLSVDGKNYVQPLLGIPCATVYDGVPCMTVYDFKYTEEK